MADEPVLRALASDEDYEACVALQRLTWGDTFRELVPPAMLLITQKMGGVAGGAFVDGRLVGFVYGLTGLRDGRMAHWSHMLAVDPAWRDRGLGRRLKAWQRAALHALGVERMYWTYDPLVARNAHLNLAVLGARIVEYRRDMYGKNRTSRTDSVIGSDRFVVEWELAGGTAGGVDGRSGGSAERAPVVALEAPALPEAAVVRIAIPHDVQALKVEHPEEARRWREVTRRAFEHYLAAGYRVTGVEGAATDARSHYVVRRDAD